MKRIFLFLLPLVFVLLVVHCSMTGDGDDSDDDADDDQDGDDDDGIDWSKAPCNNNDLHWCECKAEKKYRCDEYLTDEPPYIKEYYYCRADHLTELATCQEHFGCSFHVHTLCLSGCNENRAKCLGWAEGDPDLERHCLLSYNVCYYGCAEDCADSREG